MIDVVIDISHHNQTPDFKAAYAGGLRGCICKATQGTVYTDPTYLERAPQVRQAGLMLGAYHFGTFGDGAKQADHFLDVGRPDERVLLVLDWEQNPKFGLTTMTHAQAVAFVLRVYQRTGRYPVLYSGPAFLGEQLGKTLDPVLSKCPLWLAQYGRRADVPASWKSWTLWQYTDHGAIERNKGFADRSRFNGDLGALRKLWGFDQAPPAPAPPH